MIVKCNDRDMLRSDAAILCELCFVLVGDFCLPGFSSHEVNQYYLFHSNICRKFVFIYLNIFITVT